MTTAETLWDVIIIGAGICGLSARRTLLDRGAKVLTVEKSRGVAGRASTRRQQEGSADMGAQFISCRDESLSSLLNGASPQGNKIIHWRDAEELTCYTHTQGMSRMGRLLIEAPQSPIAPILFSSKVQSLDLTESKNRLCIVMEDNQTIHTKSIILTPPLPQSLELLAALHPHIESSVLKSLQSVTYSSCLVGAYILKEETKLKTPGILLKPSAQILGIFDQSKKGLPNTSPIVVVQGAPKLSYDLWNSSEDKILNELWQQALLAAPMNSLPENYISAWIHKWRYSEPINTLAQAFLETKALGSSPVFLAGDAFGGPGLEAAFVSGRSAGEALSKILT